MIGSETKQAQLVMRGKEVHWNRQIFELLALDDRVICFTMETEWAFDLPIFICRAGSLVRTDVAALVSR